MAKKVTKTGIGGKEFENRVELNQILHTHEQLKRHKWISYIAAITVKHRRVSELDAEARAQIDEKQKYLRVAQEVFQNKRLPAKVD